MSQALRALESSAEAAGATLPVRVVTAASLFDGHDAAINIMRRLLQAQGAEVIHLGHDRSVAEIVDAAVQEDADAVAVSSYQGGHNEFFQYLVDRLREVGAGHVRVYGGGGGTILPEEIEALHRYGVARLFSPEDGRRMGLEGMIGSIVEECRAARSEGGARPERLPEPTALSPDAPVDVARWISALENASDDAGLAELRTRLGRAGEGSGSVVGFTGTGGAGKSSVVDELVRRFRLAFPERAIGLVLVDPTRRRTGGALLGDRIRLNALTPGRPGRPVFARSMATRRAHLALAGGALDAVRVLRAAGYDLVFVETAGIGQSDSEVVDLVDHSLYVMTPEYGAPSQLEKIDMLELADLVVLNKSDRHGAADALRDVRKQWKRAHPMDAGDAVPVFPTVASDWSDAGLDRLFEALCSRLDLSPPAPTEAGRGVARPDGAAAGGLIPGPRRRYLAEIAERVRSYRDETERLATAAGEAQALARSAALLAGSDAVPGVPGEPLAAGSDSTSALRELYEARVAALPDDARAALRAWPERRAAYRADEQSYGVREREIRVRNHAETLSGSKLPKIALPATDEWSEQLRFLRGENLPGSFPFTGGVFPFKREGEDAARMFAGEGGPERTNRRFHYLAAGQPAARLSTAFDSVTLYGRDPDRRPDIYGKVGNSGVSVCTLDDAKKLYSGFDLCDPKTSVSMTINGPAPTVLAFFLNAAIDQQVEKHLRAEGRLAAVRERFGGDAALPRYGGERPSSHDGLGLGLLGIPGERAVERETYERIRSEALRSVRGTVQADILKEDQAQNTCIFSTDFSLKVMGDIQEFFVAEQVRNFYSVSISGYHMAEAGANPISQLAFTLANGFTYVEYYRARGLDVDAFAPNFSFFFSNGLDAEYNVIGRVARRIWAVALRELYGANERSQKLKYHVQTSGRSLHAQEMAFNDIRTTLQALTALQDSCNSLHTNAYDEAVTTPTEESVRRALAIQLIIARELGIAKTENALQGSYAIEWLTDRVEEAVLDEFDRLAERGGVLGAMETQYQRGRIQDESLHYEAQKHSGALPIIGVNTFENPDSEEASARPRELMRSSRAEKDAQLANLSAFQAARAEEAPAALAGLQQVASSGGNAFEELMRTVQSASLGQITDALFRVGGQYRRAM